MFKKVLRSSFTMHGIPNPVSEIKFLCFLKLNLNIMAAILNHRVNLVSKKYLRLFLKDLKFLLLLGEHFIKKCQNCTFLEFSSQA